MNQREIDEAEWKNPDNWSGPGLFIFYFSKRDSRTWVPKSIPWMGWTVNLGHPAGAKWLIALIGLSTILLVVITAAIVAASHPSR